MKSSGSDTPLACDMTAFNPEQRAAHLASTNRFALSVRRATALENGYCFQLDESSFPLTALAEWMELERRCCPFFSFTVSVEGRSECYELRLTGPAGTAEFIVFEFPALGLDRGPAAE